MKAVKRILLLLGCVSLLGVSWLMAINAKTEADKQQELIGKANEYLADEIYVLAVPLLEEAASYEGKFTEQAEELLKSTYLSLIDQREYRYGYEELLTKQMSRDNAGSDVFLEAAHYYLDTNNREEALAVMRDGIAKTEDKDLISLYEDNRYYYTIREYYYEDITAAFNGAVAVKRGGKWGVANSAGDLVIPCEYDKVSSYCNGSIVVMKDGLVYAVDTSNNRIALFHGTATDFTNLNEDVLGLKTDEGWILTDSNFHTAQPAVDEMGTASGGCIPARVGDKWGLLAANGSGWLTEPYYDNIVRDEWGRCGTQGAFFLELNRVLRLAVGGEWVGDALEDARPFADGWAAVKKDGKWGFIDSSGELKIEYQFDDARSFGQHLAAIKKDGLWGYVSLYGDIVIEPQFLEAGSFQNGSAPVLTADGWNFITLEDY